jgi:hypothetical protein
MKLSDLEKLKQSGKIKDYTETGSSKKPLKSKYGNKKTEVDGIVFDSIKESGRYIQLRYLKNAGKIKDLMLQVPFELSVNGEKVAYYVADFQYYDVETGQTIVEDVKSSHTRKLPVYRLKKKLMKSIYNITIVET